MKTRELKPIVTKDAWHKRLQVKIAAVLQRQIYDALISIAEDCTFENAKDSALIGALKGGQVRLVGSTITGKFNAAIAKELRSYGATYDNRRKAYDTSKANLPERVVSAAIRAQASMARLATGLNAIISSIPERVTQGLEQIDWLGNAADVEEEFEDDFRETVSRVISVQPKITKVMRAEIRKGYTENVERSIKGFAQDETEKLRSMIQTFVTAGRPRASLVTDLQARLRVSRERARFIARQETSLFTSQLKQTQYENAGISQYRWKAIGGKAGDGRTRDSHRAAHGKIFFWDQSLNENPVRDEKGNPQHPGTEFNCRCQAVPIVEF